MRMFKGCCNCKENHIYCYRLYQMKFIISFYICATSICLLIYITEVYPLLQNLWRPGSMAILLYPLPPSERPFFWVSSYLLSFAINLMPCLLCPFHPLIKLCRYSSLFGASSQKDRQRWTTGLADVDELMLNSIWIGQKIHD